MKRSHYETFWYAHHFFVLWFFFLLIHGPVWKYWCLPALVPYVVDRLVIRIFYRGNKRMALARIYFWGKPDKPDVVTLQFDNSPVFGVPPLHYREGHYLYLNCPAVKDGSRFACLDEWHPLTISSAPDESVLEVNIRVMPSPASWTNKAAAAPVARRESDPFTPTQREDVIIVAHACGGVVGPVAAPADSVDGLIKAAFKGEI